MKRQIIIFQKQNTTVPFKQCGIVYFTFFFKLLYIWRQPGIGVQIMTNENDMNKLHFEDAWSRLQIRKNMEVAPLFKQFWLKRAVMPIHMI